MINTLIVMGGGAMGAALRYHLGRLAAHLFGMNYPWGTLLANLLGGFAMGVLAGCLARSASGGEPVRLLLGVGVLGGFTTFSAFSLETFLMIERGEAMSALLYVLASVIGAVAALAIGLLAVRSIA
ncbi:fluoride efflux transporter CrcB [Sphingobium phenoxybenzoativorans]|uniref:Fluoride-specific ion channel FluC n=1 Tax=Sphingobium phenoxybenzoativorans TaxID=1592790 RepID=A0A975K8D2_9SPHN|nr:fluoride efflux transporter CrcB [Sphingobium phenoxybenzoativorans]QUT06362.1 fluoride efflux transporter CrcB [Sphingobium phenoxybenzoativorans]